MKQRRDPRSPFGMSLHFELDEFETMMDELRNRAGPHVFSEGKGVDVDLVLLRGLDIEADYVDLPKGVLGRTQFQRDGQARVEIRRELSDAAELDALARRRLRTTLAHEAGHVTCHAQLFFEDSQTRSLFQGEQEQAPRASKILCREDGVGKLGYRGEWWEFQANQCMACLLLPRDLFMDRVKRALRALGIESFEEAIARQKDELLIHEISRCFDVSFDVVFYRLEAFGFVPKLGQPRLPFRS